MLLVLTGPAASGKDTVRQRLLGKYPNLMRVVTTTTRQKRRGEVHGEDYNFVSRQEFEKKIKDEEFIEHIDFSGDLYGTEKIELQPFNEQDFVWRVETSRAANVKDALPSNVWDKTIVIYINTRNWEVLEDRMRRRGMPEDKIKARLEKDREDLEKYRYKFENMVFNEEGKIDETMAQIITLIESKNKKGQVLS